MKTKRILKRLAAAVVTALAVMGSAFAATTVTTEAELKAAVAAGGEITLGADIALTEMLAVASGATVTLDLSGKAITVGYQSGSTDRHLYPFDVYGTMTIKDSAGNGSITGRGIYVQNGSKVTLESGAVYGIDSNGGSAFFQYGGDIVINGGRVEQKASGTYNFAINAAAGTVTVNGGWVGGNHGAIATTGAAVVIKDGQFVCTGTDGLTDNVLYSDGTGTLIINGGTFTADSDGPSGGSCVYDANGKTVINGGTFGNSSGGDVWGKDGGTVINGGTFENLSETEHVTVGSTITNAGKTYTKTEDGLTEVFPAYVVLPEGTTVSNYETLFGDKTVTDGTVYYATLKEAVEAVCGTAGAKLYCKPGADVGSLQHAPVTASLTVYGNGASVTGDTERDFDIGNTDPSGGADITADMTLTVKNLNGCGAWGAKATAYTVNLVFEDCANMGKVFITGQTGTLNITMTDCAFEGVIKEALYSNADGAITLTNVDFSNLNKAVNLNHKATGTQTVTMTGCSFTDCGADVAADQIPVRVLSSVEGGKSVLTVDACTFSGTPEGGADILIDYGVGETTAMVTTSTTAANVVVEKTNNVGETTTVPAGTTTAQQFTTAKPVAKIGDVYYETLKEAFTAAAAAKGATIDLLDSEYDGSLKMDTTTDVVLNEGTYTLTGGKGVLLPAELFLQSTDATKPVKLVIAEGAHVTIPKLTLRDNAELEITKARLDSAIFQGGSAYLSVYNNAKLTATEAVIGYNPVKTGSADPVNTVVGMYNNWGYRISVYGTATFDNSKVYAYVGQADNCGFDVLGSGSVTATDSTIYTALFKVGEAYSSKYLNSAADTSDLTATLALTETTVENIMYRGDSTNNNGLRIGNSADATVKGAVTITDSTVDFTKIVYGDSREVGLKVQNANSSVTIANSTVKFPNGANVGTINVTDSTVELAKFDNDYLMFISGENTVRISDATGSSYAVRVKDGAVLNNSYIKSTDNMTTRFLGSATLNGGYECAYLQGGNASQGGVGGTLTIEDGTTVKVSYGVDFGHNYVINGGTIELSSGNASGSIWGCVFQNGEFTINADIVVNGGTSTAPIHFTSATATVNGSITQTAPGGEVIYITGSDVTFASTSTVTSDTGVHVTNSSLASAGNVNANIKANEGATIAISGGTYTQAIPAEWCADGFTPVSLGNGTYGVGILPNAEVSNLGAVTVGEGCEFDVDSYYVYDLIGGSGLSSASEPFKLSIAMDFTAKDTPEEAAANAFGAYTTDFFITMDGMTQESFSGDGCYLAGYYPSFNAWVKIPLDGFTIEKGMTYPVITSAGFDFSYEAICETVGQFICGIYLTPEVLAANPNMTVDLTLGLSEDFDAAQDAEFTTVDKYVYDVEDLIGDSVRVVVPGKDADGNEIAVTNKFKTLQAAIDAIESEGEITLLGDVTVSETVTIAAGKEVELDLAGFDITPDNDQVNLMIYGDLYIDDSVVGGVSTFRNHWVQDGGKLAVNGGTVQNISTASGGYAINLNSGATAIVNGGTVQAVNTSNYAVNVSGSAKLTVNGGVIKGIFGGLYNTGTVVFNRGTVEVTQGRGGHCVCNDNYGEITINGGTFNPYNKDGSATCYPVYVAAGGSAVITGGTFDKELYGRALGCAAGGSIAVSGGTFASSGQYFESNLAAFVVDAHEAVDNGNGTWTVKPYVTYYNEKGYTSLADAIAAAVAAGATASDRVTLTLVGNVHEEIVLPESVIIDVEEFTVDSVLDGRDDVSIVEVKDGAYDVTQWPVPPPVRSIVLSGDKVELRFVPRATLAWVKVLMSTNLKDWSEMTGTTVTDNGIGQEAVVTAPKPEGSKAFFKVTFEYKTSEE